MMVYREYASPTLESVESGITLKVFATNAILKYVRVAFP